MSHSILQRSASLIAAAAVLHVVLIQPNHPAAATWQALLMFPLELPALLLTLVALGRSRAAWAFRLGVTTFLAILAVLKTADFVSFNALSRSFNPVSDMFLVDAFVRLLFGSFGPVLAVLCIIGAILAVILVATLIWWATGVWSKVNLGGILKRVAAAGAVVASAIMLFDIGVARGTISGLSSPPGAAFTARVAVERVSTAQKTLKELKNFRIAADEDVYAGREDLLGTIARDVVVIFVESYGRASFDVPFYASSHVETLKSYGSSLDEVGLATKSGWLKAPTFGGQSWLSHATFANGLWVDNQAGYGALLSSDREGLFHHARNSGFRTGAVMPQITLDWPESARMGFDEVLVAADLGYKGLPFNWVTMPDQFTLLALDTLLREAGDEKRLFAQVALASSHAPWVPVPQLLPWDEVGDGSAFNEMAVSGDAPEVVWRDRERVRDQYRLAVDYSLSAVFEYALLHAEEPPLLIIVGDHQAAEMVSMDTRRDVPIHVVGPKQLVDLVAEIVPTDGIIPDRTADVLPMNQVRDIILKAFSVQTTAEVSQ
ncbi:sulfatase [Amaricoccus tamworthensis]|uniref:sulfatase n=1 Tax=Amaricoccus tamworthensis TaxID=57002 RepID=UPI003C7CEE56